MHRHGVLVECNHMGQIGERHGEVQLLGRSQTNPNTRHRPPMATHRVLIEFGSVLGGLFVAIAAAPIETVSNTPSAHRIWGVLE